jgi:hypothetical protein
MPEISPEYRQELLDRGCGSEEEIDRVSQGLPSTPLAT